MFDLKPEIITLSNGLRLVYLHVPNQVAHLGVNVLGGSRYERPNEEGLAHFLEHCIFKGTKNRKTFHILSRLDSVGGELNAYTAKEEICVYASFTKEHLMRAADLLADIVVHSNFPIKEIEKEKEIILDEINSYLDSPGDKIFDDFEAHLFKGNSLGNNILGTPERVRSFTQNDLRSYLERYFTIDKMVLSFVGDCSKVKVLDIMEKCFAACNEKGVPAELNVFQSNQPFSIRSKEANYQCHAVVGGLAPGYKEDSRKVMTLVTNMLGGPALNSRLNLSIREKYGYAYNVESNYTPYVDTGFWTIYLGTDQKYIDKSLSLIEKELDLFRSKKLGVLQLQRAKVQLKGHLALGMDSNSGLMLGLGKSVLLFDQIDTIQEIYDGIDRISAEDILEVSNRYFSKESCSSLVFDLIEN